MWRGFALQCFFIIVVILTNAGVSAYSYYEYYEEELPVIMSNVTCEGDESRLIDCPFTSGGNGSPVSLTCSSESK